jgi:DNA-binding FadR family transcriptional regulator
MQVPKRGAAHVKRVLARRHSELVSELGVLILKGTYPPGRRLKSEIIESNSLKVSRGAYREILRTLKAKGLLTGRTRTGTRVAPLENWHLLDPDVLGWMRAANLRGRMLSAFLELRAFVHPSIAALAARRRKASQVKQLRQALEIIQSCTVEPAIRDAAISDFNVTVGKATGNPYLAALARAMAVGVTTADRESRKRQHTIYRQLLVALENKDAVRAHRIAGMIAR